MTSVHKSLRSTVSRRIFLLFIICALVPILVHSLFSYFQVRQQLVDQSRQRLANQNKTVSASFMERLILLNDDLSMLAGRLRTVPPSAWEESLVRFTESVNSRFTSLTFLPGLPHTEPLPDGARAQLQAGKAVLTCRTEEKGVAIQLLVAIDASDPNGGVLRGAVNPAFLWHPAQAWQAPLEISVINSQGNMLFTTFTGPVQFENKTMADFLGVHAGHFRYRAAGRNYLASHRSIYLQPHFLSPPWVVALSEPMSSVLEPAAEFQRFFPLILLLTLTTIVALSLIRIRQTLTPVRRLQEATQKIAGGELGHQVEIRSRDEFEVLGESFNRMSLQLKENEAMLLQAERLSTIGRMSAGMVHEIKQPMTALSGHLFLAMEGTTSPEMLTRLGKIDVAMKRLLALVDKYRVFSRKSADVQSEVSLNEVAAQVYELFEHQFLLRRINCKIEKQPGLPVIMGDSSELQQVMTNLLTNAMDAIDEAEGERREIEMHTIAANGCVGIRIRDTGCGISPEDRQRIFEPFFTTKSVENGTGLGLAVIRTILTRHEARIDVESEPGKGSSITVNFPVADSSTFGPKNAEPA